jgi:hypothetical protein
MEPASCDSPERRLMPFLPELLSAQVPVGIEERRHELAFSDRRVMPLELSAIADDDRACAVEHDTAARGQPDSPPGAGIAVHVRGESGRLAAVPFYDDVHPPLDRRTNGQRRLP